MATDAGPGEDILRREEEEERRRRERESGSGRIAGPPPVASDVIDLPDSPPDEPRPTAGPASVEPDFYKPGGVDQSQYDDRSYGGPWNMLYTAPAVLAGASGVSTAINRTGHALIAEEASEDYYKSYILDKDRQEMIDNLRLVRGLSESEINDLIEEERRWLDGMRVSRPERLKKAHYLPIHIEEGEEDDPYVKDHWAYKATPNLFRTHVNEDVSNNPLIQADPEYFAMMEKDGRTGLRRGADRFAQLQRDYLYSYKSSPMVKAWVDWNESIDMLEKQDPEFVEALINSSGKLGVGLIDLTLNTLGMGKVPEGYTRGEFANELGETLGVLGMAGFAGAVTGNWTRSLKYDPSPLLVFLVPAVAKVVKGTATPATRFTVEQATKLPGLGPVVKSLRDKFQEGMKADIPIPQMVRQPGRVEKGKVDYKPEPGEVRPSEFRQQRYGEIIPETIRDVGMSTLLGVPHVGIPLMALRAMHRSALKSNNYRAKFNELAKTFQRRKAEDLETHEAIGEASERIGRPARVMRSMEELVDPETKAKDIDRKDVLPTEFEGQPVDIGLQRRPTSGEAFIGETTARRVAPDEGGTTPPPQEGRVAPPQQEVAVPPPQPKAPPGRPEPIPLAPEVVDAPTIYEVPLGENTFVSVVSPDQASIARRSTRDQIRQNAVDELSRGIDEQAAIDKSNAMRTIDDKARARRTVQGIERERVRFQKELEQLGKERDRSDVQREQMAMRMPLREAIEARELRIEGDLLSPGGIVQQTLANLSRRFGDKSVKKAYNDGLAEFGPSAGITMSGKLVEGSPLEVMVRKGADVSVPAEWVARPKSQRQLEAQTDWISGEEGIGAKAPEVVTEYRRTKDADPDAKPPVKTESFQRAEAAAKARGATRLEGAKVVGEKQVFTRTGDKQRTPKQYTEAVKRRKETIEEIMKTEKTDRVFAEIIYDDMLATEQKAAKKKADRTPEQVSTDYFNARIDGWFNSMKKAFSVKDDTVAPDILYRRSKKGEKLPLTEKLKEEGKTEGNSVYGTQQGYLKMAKQIVADIARDKNLGPEARRALLERFQRNESQSLFPPNLKGLSEGFPTTRLEVEAYKRGEIPIQIEAASRPTRKKFVEDPKSGLRGVVGKLKKRLAERKITLDEYTAALHEQLYQLTEDVKGVRGVKPTEVKTIQALVSELRGRTDPEGRVRGPKTEVNIYNTRVGRWAAERIARMSIAKRERKDVTHLGDEGSLATELRPVFNYLKQEIRNAEEKAAARQGTRYHDHLTIARDHYRGKDVSGRANPRFVEWLDKLVKERASNKPTDIALLRKQLADTVMTRPEKHTLERVIDSFEAKSTKGGTAKKAGLRKTDLDGIMKEHDKTPKANKVAEAKIGQDTTKTQTDGPPIRRTREVSETWAFGFTPRFVAKFRQMASEILRVDSETAIPQIRRLHKGIKEIFDHGESLVLSDSMKKLMANRIVREIAKDLSPENQEAARKSVYDWFTSYDSPMNIKNLSSKWSDAPHSFRLLNSDGSVYATFPMNKLIENTFRSLSQKERNSVIKEAIGRLGERASEYAAEKGTELTIKADRMRWGYSQSDTPLSAAIKMARSVVLYNDANPLFPPTVLMKPDKALAKEMGLPKVDRPTRIKVTEYGEALRGNKQALIDDFNTHMQESHGRNLNKKEMEFLFGKDKEGISPESKVGRFIENLDNQKNFSEEGRNPLMDLLQYSVGLSKEQEKKAKSKPKDKDLPVDHKPGVFDTFVDPDWYYDVGWEVAYRKGMDNIGPQITMYLKQKVTSESTLTNIGNTLSNITAIALTTGEIPIEVISRIGMSYYSFHLFRKDPKKFLIDNPELGEAFMAVGDTGLLKTNFADQELGQNLNVPRQHQVGKFKWSSHGEAMRLRDMAVIGGGTALLAGPAWGAIVAALAGAAGPKRIARMREFRRWMYGFQDNAPKLAEFTRHYVDTKQWLNRHDVGDTVHIQTTRNADVVIRKTGKGETGWEIGYGARGRRESRGLKAEELRKIIASYSARRSYGRIFNYADAPRILKKMRTNSFFGPFSQFTSYPYFAADLPGKPGLISGTILDNLNPGLRSTNVKANIELAGQAFSQGMRKTMLAAQVLQLNHPFEEDLSKLSHFGVESAFNSESIIWDLDNPNAVATVRTSNADGWKKSRDIAIIGLANLAQLRGEPVDKNAPRTATRLFGKTGKAFDDAVERNMAWLRRKVQTGETLQAKDYMALFEMSGTQMVSLWADLKRADSNTKKTETTVYQRVISRMAGAVMGVDLANTAKVLRGIGLGDIQPADPTHPYSAFRYEMEAQRRLNPGMSADDEMGFMLDSAIMTALNVMPRTKVIIDEKGFNPFIKMVQRSLDDGISAQINKDLENPKLTPVERKTLEKQRDRMKKDLDKSVGERIKIYKKIVKFNKLRRLKRKGYPVRPETLKTLESQVVGKRRRSSDERRDAAQKRLKQRQKEYMEGR